MSAVPTDHSGLLVLPEDECVRLLRSHPVHLGRVGFVADGRPVVLPVNYRWHDGAIVFRTDWGAKLGAIRRRQPAVFEVDWVDPAWEEGWSVLVEGVAEEVTDPAELEVLATLPLRPWAPGRKPIWARVRAEKVSGRRIV